MEVKGLLQPERTLAVQSGCTKTGGIGALAVRAKRRRGRNRYRGDCSCACRAIQGDSGFCEHFYLDILTLKDLYCKSANE